MKKKLLISIVSIILTVTLTIGVSAMYAGSLYFRDFDSSADDYICKLADGAFEDGYMIGVGGEYFAPKRELTHGELITVLYRVAGSPKVIDPTTGSHQWYHLSLLWGESIGLIDTSKVSHYSIATRDEIVSVIYSFAVHMGVDVGCTSDTSVLEDFKDCASISDTSRAAWCYAVHNKMIGDKEEVLMPDSSITREQFLTILNRLTGIFANNRADSELWVIPEGKTVITEAPENAATARFSVDLINNRYLIENEKGEYICTTTEQREAQGDSSNSEMHQYVYGTIPCYESKHILEFPYPWYYIVIPDSDTFTVTPLSKGNVDFTFKGCRLEGYGITKVTFEGSTVTVYGTRATIRTTNADEAGYTVVFADK